EVRRAQRTRLPRRCRHVAHRHVRRGRRWRAKREIEDPRGSCEEQHDAPEDPPQPAQRHGQALVCGHPARIREETYFTRVSILNIGMYIEMMMMPTMTPTPIIMIGSTIEVSDCTDASTSSS